MLKVSQKTNFNYRSENGSLEAFGALTGAGSFMQKEKFREPSLTARGFCPDMALPPTQSITTGLPASHGEVRAHGRWDRCSPGEQWTCRSGVRPLSPA